MKIRGRKLVPALLLIFGLTLAFRAAGAPEETLRNEEGKPERYAGKFSNAPVRIPVRYQPKRSELRGVWVATVENIDFAQHQDAASFKKEYLEVVNNLKAANCNAIFFQVRPNCDAFYASKENPWSRWMTGTEGLGIPGFDPLKFMVDEAHKRGLEFHAWLNPYRVDAAAKVPKEEYLKTRDPRNFARRHPELVLQAKLGPNRYSLLLNPGEPAVIRHIIDTVPVVRDAVESGKKILLEGQLGIMRDNDWGIYPYSTSSNPTAAGGCNGAGIPPRAINKVVGVAKAYSTSVGGGPYMTELFDADGDKLRDIGHEFGVTTGRPRRCGWFDAVAADYACYMNGVTDVALTKLDVLDTFPKIKVCTGYRIDGEYYTHLPETRLQERAKPVYEEFDGWMSDTTACRTWESLPEKAKEYILALEKLMNTHITYISVGPERDQLIIR